MQATLSVITLVLFWVAAVAGVAGLLHELYLTRFDARTLEPKFAIPGMRSAVLRD